MSKHARISSVTALILLGTAPATFAGWTGKGNLGASFATGNSENQSVSGALEMKYTQESWQHTFGVAGNYGNDGSTTTAQRWEARAVSATS